MVMVYVILCLMFFVCCAISLPFVLKENNTKRHLLYLFFFYLSFQLVLTALASIFKLTFNL